MQQGKVSSLVARGGTCASMGRLLGERRLKLSLWEFEGGFERERQL